MQARAIPAAGFSGAIQAEVLALETGRTLSAGWRDAGPGDACPAEWTITWTLQPEGTGTRLFLAHEGFDPDSPVQQRARKIMGRGWRSDVTGRLQAVLSQPGTPAHTPGRRYGS